MRLIWLNGYFPFLQVNVYCHCQIRTSRRVIFRECIAQGIFIRSSWLFLLEFWEFNMYFVLDLWRITMWCSSRRGFLCVSNGSCCDTCAHVSFQNVISMIDANVKYHSGSFSFLNIHNCLDRLLQIYLI